MIMLNTKANNRNLVSYLPYYSFMAVEVKGRNLKEVRQAIQDSRCKFIQEYHENEFLPPGKDDPVIESIRFITGEKLDDILADHKTGKHHAG